MPYIEFFGAPGSGKTTAARALLRDQTHLRCGRRSLSLQNDARCVTSLGLPARNPRALMHLGLHLPRDLLLAARYLRDTRRLSSAVSMLKLLVKSRALAASPYVWVVDQGLQQHVLSTLARGHLSPEAARWWKRACRSAPWAAQRLIYVEIDREELLRRVRASEKHLRQSRDRPEEYVEAFSRGLETYRPNE